MNTNENSNATWWRKAGLPGVPVLARNGRPVQDAASLVRDGNGKAVLFEKPNPEPVVRALMCHFSQGMEAVHFVADDQRVPDVIGFAITTGGPLSIVQRIQAKTVVDLFEQYNFVNRSSESYRLPAAFGEYIEGLPGRAWGIPAKLATEEKAIQLAQVAEYTLGTDAEVVRDTDGGFFVVIPHTDRVTRGEALLRLVYAIDLLNRFDLISGGDEGAIDVENDEQKMFDSSYDSGEQYNIQARIESKLDTILSRLGQAGAAAETPLADSIATGAELLENIAAARKANRPGKSASKRSA